MSYSVEWIDPVYNRHHFDVTNAEKHRYLTDPKGWFNYIDLNRIENNTIYTKEYMLDLGIIQSLPTMSHKTDWVMGEVVDSVEMSRIIENVRILMSLSNPEIMDTLQPLTTTSVMSYLVANAIERNLEIMSTQPKIPIQLYKITLNDGIIEETGTNTGEFPADTVIHISSNNEDINYTNPDEYCIAFNNWSGNKDDLQYLGDLNAQHTTLICQHHDIELTANFKNDKLVRIIVEEGYIYGDYPCKEVDYLRVDVKRGPENIHGTEYIAKVGEVLNLCYGITGDSNHDNTVPNNKYVYTSINNLVTTLTYEGMTHLPHEKFAGWTFYADEPFLLELHELKKESILLDGCDTANTTMTVPNINTLIIRPKFLYLPRKIVFQNRYNMTDLDEAVEVSFDTTTEYTFTPDKAYETAGYKFAGWIVSNDKYGTLLQHERVDFMLYYTNSNPIRQPWRLEFSKGTNSRSKGYLPLDVFETDLFGDRARNVEPILYVYAMWVKNYESLQASVNSITRGLYEPVHKDILLGEPYNSTQPYRMVNTISLNGVNIKTVDYKDTIYELRDNPSVTDDIAPGAMRIYMPAKHYGDVEITYKNAVGFEFVLFYGNTTGTTFEKYQVYMPLNTVALFPVPRVYLPASSRTSSI